MISLILASEWATNRNKFIVKSIDFDRFNTSEGSYTLILPFTSEHGATCSAKQTKDFLI